jgi:hypothetical protein
MGVVPPSVRTNPAAGRDKLPDPPDFLDHVETHLGVGEPAGTRPPTTVLGMLTAALKAGFCNQLAASL